MRGTRERVIAWGRGSGGVVVATDAALVLPDGERLAWTSIDRAEWRAPMMRVLLDPAGRQARSIDLSEAGEVPAAVRAYVTESVVVSEHVDLGDGAGARLVARRSPSGGDIAWTVVMDEGLDASDPALRARAQEALDRLRASLGI